MNRVKVIYKNGNEVIIRTNLSVETVKQNILESQHRISITIDNVTIYPKEVIDVI